MPPYRTFAPSGRLAYYRLTAPLPMIVDFPSVAYTVALESVPAAGRHELLAHDARRAVWPRIGPCYRSAELLREAVFLAGVPVRADTIGGVILLRLVSEGRAVLVAAPADDPAERWPAQVGPLGRCPRALGSGGNAALVPVTPEP